LRAWDGLTADTGRDHRIATLAGDNLRNAATHRVYLRSIRELSPFFTQRLVCSSIGDVLAYRGT
jgi:hypothetical protein